MAVRVAVENIMLVSLSLRPCSQTIIPAELPSGPSMGESIDLRFKPQLEKLRGIQDQKAKIKEIGEIKKGMAYAFDEIIESSPEYNSLLTWAKKLGLKINHVKVRPTIHELYIYKEKETLKELQRLMQDRGKLRIEAIKKPDPKRGQLHFAYPEEFNSKWICAMGRLLGYPDCCVERYADDREQGINVESRAAKQLKELLTSPDPHVYLASYFLPCSPSCEKARQKGLFYHDKLSGTLLEAGEAYETILRENLDRVRMQPEVISEYLSKFKSI